jgi:CheY-like chemotaxis protein
MTSRRVAPGLEGTRAIRQLPNLADTPKLAMTANAFDEDRDRCLAAETNAHISQPVEADSSKLIHETAATPRAKARLSLFLSRLLKPRTLPRRNIKET